MSVDKPGVPVGNKQRPLGLDQGSHERSELDEPATNARPQHQGVIKARSGDPSCGDFVGPREVIDEPVFHSCAPVTEALELRQGHAEDDGDEFHIEGRPRRRVAPSSIIDGR